MKIIKVKAGGRIFRVKDCKGLSSVRGLMLDDMKNYDGAMIYANSIWMPLVRRELKLLFLDGNMKVVKSEIARPISFSFRTWRSYSCSGAKYCLELKDMSVEVRNGQKVAFIK